MTGHGAVVGRRRGGRRFGMLLGDLVATIVRLPGEAFQRARDAVLTRATPPGGEPDLGEVDARSLLEKWAPEYLHMTADEFIALWRRDELPDTPTARHLAMLVGPREG